VSASGGALSADLLCGGRVAFLQRRRQPLGDRGHRGTRGEDLGDAHLLELGDVAVGDDAATEDEDIVEVAFLQQREHTGEQRHVRPRQERQPHRIGVLLDNRLDDLLRRLVQAGVYDLEAGVAQRSGDDLGTPIVSVEAGLGDDNAIGASHGPNTRWRLAGGPSRLPNLLSVPPHPLVEEWDAGLAAGDPLRFPGYIEQLRHAPGESVITGRTAHYAVIEGRFDVLGGSMGAAHGERVVRTFDRAVRERLPVVVLAGSGGARLQEGMVSLVQMARTAAAARRHARAGLLSLAVYTNPTTGGVFASYAALSDLRAAEPGAIVGFAGPRVVEQTLGRLLPPGSHTAESAYDNGLVDALVGPEAQGPWMEAALGLLDVPLDVNSGISEPSAEMDPADDAPPGAWSEVVRARDPRRPTGIDWAGWLCTSWTELRGPERVVRAGLTTIGDDRVVVIANDRRAGDGRPRPADYRLAQRAIALAGRLGLPLLSLVDTPGADPGPESEAAGVAREIALTLAAMAEVPTPTVAVCVGEGGSGGALALAHADRLLIQEHAIFSVIAPEGAAAILERDAGRAPEVAGRLRLTSRDALELSIVDDVVAEQLDAMVTAVAAALRAAVPGDRERRLDRATARWLQ
jgi:acetyl-CoA carboxylase alpha subunit